MTVDVTISGGKRRAKAPAVRDGNVIFHAGGGAWTVVKGVVLGSGLTREEAEALAKQQQED